ncbi:hypothetical protein ACFYM0_35980 [Streptomyces sp. NPDC006487]|uniref:hypothetical protein n=1 Tax=Streptomyces sp. NPDC006487 TaxID=3364748 RepID=UPI0036B6DAEF
MTERPTSPGLPATTGDDTPEAFYAMAAALQGQDTKAAAKHAAVGALLAIAAARDPETGEVRSEDARAVEAVSQLETHAAWPVFNKLLERTTAQAAEPGDNEAWISALEQDLRAGGPVQDD